MSSATTTTEGKTLPKMQYVRFGNTGLRVSRFALGCMSYGSSKWQAWVKDEEESIDLIGKAYDAGINFFDTADGYSNGESERILGKAIKKFNMPRSRIAVATKVFFTVADDVSVNLLGQQLEGNPDYLNSYGLSRKHIFDAVDASLERLGLNYIDLYQIHRFDHNTPIEETMEALNDLVRSGKVRYIGCSSCYAWEFQKANAIAEKNGWAKFSSMQNLYNLLYREEEREMIPYCVDSGIASIHWSPLARGLLTGKSRNSVRTETDHAINYFFAKKESANNDLIVDRVVEIAEKHGHTPAQIALGWMLTKKHVTSPIVGIGRESHLYDILGALDVKLSDEEIKYLEEAYIPRNLIPIKPTGPNPLEDPELVNGCGLSRKHIFDAIDASLKRLDLDYVDLYQIHRFDHNTPIEETMEALNDLVRSGKVRYIGCSSCYAWEFQKANAIAEKNGWAKFSSMQNFYNLLYREEEREMIPYCVDSGIASIHWSPLARGLLTGKNRKTVRVDNDPPMKRYFVEKESANNDLIVDRVIEVSERLGYTPAQIALGWMLSKPHVTSPIVGVSSEAHLYDIIGSLEVKLSEEDVKYLEEAYIPHNVIPM